MRGAWYLGLFLCLAMGAAGSLQARSLEANLNNDAAQFRVNIYPAGATALGETRLAMGFLYTADDDYVVAAGLMVAGQTGSESPGLEAGVGLHAYGGRTGRDNDFAAIALSGMLDYRPPALDRLHLGLYIDYAPRIVTFMDGKHFLHYGLRIGYDILQQALVYVGYRAMELGAAKGKDDTIDDGAVIGVEFYF